ncbi:MAG: PspC family transcriptional regulator [Pseudonocardiales bacterium]|nr:PspC family transcriptional regulator [Pseudonocardiales bacterium]
MSDIKVQDTVRDFWATRPHRRTNDRKVAGVAAAIGRRYAIDPVLVRVAFVVAAVFGGSGVLLYLLGWLLLPLEGDQASGAERMFRRGRSSMSAVLIVVLVLLLLPASAAVLSGRASGVLGLLVALGTLVLLHRSRSALGEIPGTQRTPPTAPAATEPATSGTTTSAAPPATGTATDQPAPPAWDPLGAAPFAWDLPEPAAPPMPATPPQGVRSKVTPITLGLALLTGGIALAFAPGLSAAGIAALLLGVVGLGLVVGAFMQSGRGLILLAIPLALLTWVLHAAPAAGFKVGGSHWDPVTAAELQPRYAVTLGNGRLDLTGLRLAPGQTVKSSVNVGIGQTHVILPPNIDAQVSCQTQVGRVDCLGQSSSDRVDVTDNGLDGPGGGKVILDVHSGVGEIHVERES